MNEFPSYGGVPKAGWYNDQISNHNLAEAAEAAEFFHSVLCDLISWCPWW